MCFEHISKPKCVSCHFVWKIQMTSTVWNGQFWLMYSQSSLYSQYCCSFSHSHVRIQFGIQTSLIEQSMSFPSNKWNLNIVHCIQCTGSDLRLRLSRSLDECSSPTKWHLIIQIPLTHSLNGPEAYKRET